MKKKALILLSFLLTVAVASFSQTCTLTGAASQSWTNPGPACAEGGNAGSKTILVIPAGFTLTFNSVADTWTGTRIDVSGTLTVSADVTINSSVAVKNGGLVNLNAKLALGTSAGCGYTMPIYTGGTVNVGGTGSDRLGICGADLMKGNGSCNNCGGTNSGKCAYNGNPYCEPAGGFQGPSGYGEGGFDGTLPITLLYFNASAQDQLVKLAWATTMEKNFRKFVIQRSQNGTEFQEIGEVNSLTGGNISGIETKYLFEDKMPLAGFNYYRLKAVDLDDAYQVFDVVGAKVSGAKHVSIYPNPTSSKSMFVYFNFSPSEDAQVSITNYLGIEALRIPASTIGDRITFENDLTPGIYFVKYNSSDFQQVIRLVIK